MASTTQGGGDDTSSAEGGSETTAGVDPCPVGELIACFEGEPMVCMCEEVLGEVGGYPRGWVDDFDGDGDRDAVVMVRVGEQTEATSLVNDGRGGLVVGGPYLWAEPLEGAHVDEVDAMYAVSGDVVVPYDLEVGFSPGVSVGLAAASQEDVELGDFDGDGTIDLVRKSWDQVMGQQITGLDLVYDVLGPDAAVEHHDLPSRFAYYYSTIHACDVDGDGNSEIFDVIFGRGLLSPAPQAPLSWTDTPGVPGSMVCRDVDDDGSIDLILGWETDTNDDELVAYGNGDGTFARAQMLPPPPYGEIALTTFANPMPVRIILDEPPALVAIGEQLIGPQAPLGFIRQPTPRTFEDERGALADILSMYLVAAVDLEGDGRDELLISSRTGQPDDAFALSLVRFLVM